MHESLLSAERLARAIRVVTGRSAAAGIFASPSPVDEPVKSEYCTIHLRNRFALTLWVSAVRATDTPGRLHNWANARLASTLYEQRPVLPRLVTRPATTSAIFSDIVSTS